LDSEDLKNMQSVTGQEVELLHFLQMKSRMSFSNFLKIM
jgi:hypothetical protein